MLSEERMQELKNRLTSEDAQKEETVVETKSSSENQEKIPDKEVKQEPASSSGSDNEEEKSIPYSRFKEVNHQKSEYKQKLDAAQKELDDLRKLKDNFEKSKVESKVEDDDSWLDEYLDPSDKKQDDHYSSLDQRLRVFEKERIEKELETTVSAYQKKYSDMDAEMVESIIYKSIAENPNASLDEVLDSTQSFIQSIEKKALEKHGMTKEKNPPPTAPSRPSIVKDFSLKSGNNEGQKKIENIQDASQRLREYLAKNKVF